MRSLYLRVLVACMTLMVLCESGVWLAGTSAPPPDAFEETLRNPLRPRDHSRRVDRLALTDTADAFRAGKTDCASITDGKTARVVLTQTGDVGFPRRGSWTGPETVADFPFTELVPSWNVITPKDTGVFFHLRTRDAASRAWSPWLFVGRWGRTVHGHTRPDERLPNDRITRFAHGAVRSDMPLVLLNRPADAYQVRATLQSFDLDPAVNPGVRRVAVAYSGVIPDPVERARLLSRCEPGDEQARGLVVPHVSQYDAPPPLREAVCLPACVTMVLAYWKVDRPLAENALAIYDPDTGMFGNGARAVARAGELGLDGWLRRVRDWDQVKTLLRRGQPVIAAVRTPQGGGHLIVIRGFTREGEVIVNDPLDRKKGETARKAERAGAGMVRMRWVRLRDPAAGGQVSTRRFMNNGPYLDSGAFLGIPLRVERAIIIRDDFVDCQVRRWRSWGRRRGRSLPSISNSRPVQAASTSWSSAAARAGSCNW